MASANLELARLGGRLNTETGQQFSTTDADRIGDIGMQNLLHYLMLWFFDGKRTTPAPLSGIIRDEFDGDHCKVTSTGDLTFSVSSGFGMLFDSTQLGADEWDPRAYRPIVLSTASAGTLTAHDATNPRIDIVCIEPTWVADQAATRNVKNPSTGVITTPSVNQRQRPGATVTVVTGTPGANPSIPATPAGKIRIASARVPAVSGAATWQDDRQVLALGTPFKAVPKTHTSDFVPLGDANELLVEAQSPAAMSVKVRAGRVVINGVMKTGQFVSSLAIGASNATLERQDIVCISQDGAISVTAGSNAAVGASVAAATPANSVKLATVLVDPTVTSITAGKITDERVREPFSGALLQDQTVSYDKMEFIPPIFTILSCVEGSGATDDTQTITFELRKVDGTQYNVARDAAGQDLYFTARAHIARKVGVAGVNFNQANPHDEQSNYGQDGGISQKLGFALVSPLEPWDAYDVLNDGIEVWHWEVSFKIPSDETVGPWVIKLLRSANADVAFATERTIVKIMPAMQLGGGAIIAQLWTT